MRAEGERVAASAAEIDELLDVIRQLLGFTRAGTFDQAPGELAVWRRANAVMDRYAPQPLLARDPEWPPSECVCAETSTRNCPVHQNAGDPEWHDLPKEC